MEEVKQELVIVRRRSAFAEEAHHGGVWKIAYADFMTAMMAFFLVMWLLNALNQDQKQVVASYFNPIKLAENAPAPKGLKDLSKKEPTTFEGQDGRRQPAGPSEERRGDSPTAEKPPFYEEKVLFRDPYATLAEIANSANQASGQRRAGALTSAEEDGLKGGDAYRDPFDPGYWKLAPQASKDSDRIIESEPKPNAPVRDNATGTGQGEPQARRSKTDDAGGSVAPNADASSASLSPLLPPGPAPAPSPSQSSREGSAQANAQSGAQASAAAQGRPGDTPKDSEPRDAAQTQQPTVKQLQSAIAEALSDIKAGAGPAAEVRQVEEGLLVSLTDDTSFGMFAVGSAEPRPELIRVIDKIGPLLMKRQGMIIVRGHTDNRPYKSETYDNWRLSTARAQMAYYMLVRSGVDAQRIEHVEGYADRRPKLQNDPAAAQNRRIEILIREKRP
ncbi:motB [Bradyrhizobium diazoefficiens USDA 110]|uniref:MotB protein n=1 Tax=Bradyrhizobium diazoefficiens (strain JCM 10833 / BCRC 13528 / IAM 13628 / NBRC 14792 / USDA 110) TaxID=224911 RepID=Q89F39_BRADU|nr:MotB family protein [Bradyrhizobium diazoefficiens]AND91866.1 flagellar motor protein MotB [Bradyrhizobium diazoefficiens USDA 110]PDT61751.1 flagellar motor protein MotB [Bradyrhizobium diazoefficiens]QBP25603.1 MotB family protein [Bradyrhizobium diazoefficiens]QLD41532.1 MotB family protein [Bradyrhizobium diazoefficiens]BAC52127.1 motB [Bradyrhizobium diazoefficiens USDA 110]